MSTDKTVVGTDQEPGFEILSTSLVVDELGILIYLYDESSIILLFGCCKSNNGNLR